MVSVAASPESVSVAASPESRLSTREWRPHSDATRGTCGPTPIGIASKKRRSLESILPSRAPDVRASDARGVRVRRMGMFTQSCFEQVEKRGPPKSEIADKFDIFGIDSQTLSTVSKKKRDVLDGFEKSFSCERKRTRDSKNKGCQLPFVRRTFSRARPCRSLRECMEGTLVKPSRITSIRSRSSVQTFPLLHAASVDLACGPGKDEEMSERRIKKHRRLLWNKVKCNGGVGMPEATRGLLLQKSHRQTPLHFLERSS